MAILKTSKNMTVTVKNSYTAIAKKMSKTAESIKIDATKDNLVLSCLKKITANGEKGE